MDWPRLWVRRFLLVNFRVIKPGQLGNLWKHRAEIELWVSRLCDLTGLHHRKIRDTHLKDVMNLVTTTGLDFFEALEAVYTKVQREVNNG